MDNQKMGHEKVNMGAGTRLLVVVVALSGFLVAVASGSLLGNTAEDLCRLLHEYSGSCSGNAETVGWAVGVAVGVFVSLSTIFLLWFMGTLDSINRALKS